MAMEANEILSDANDTVNDREGVHGAKTETFQNIALLWGAFLGARGGVEALTGVDVALMMALVKIARTQRGEYNHDDYVDLAGYAACAGELAGEDWK